MRVLTATETRQVVGAALSMRVTGKSFADIH
jgi:hypothetical protein